MPLHTAATEDALARDLEGRLPEPRHLPSTSTVSAPTASVPMVIRPSLTCGPHPGRRGCVGPWRNLCRACYGEVAGRDKPRAGAPPLALARLHAPAQVVVRPGG